MKDHPTYSTLPIKEEKIEYSLKAADLLFH